MDRAELGKTPVTENQPAGEDVRFEANYEALSDEIEKLSSPTASGAVDWPRVIELCETILSGQSKDLLVACYLCTALTRTQGWEGLETGVHVLRDLVETFWDTLYPVKKRVKGRINALAWWEEKTRAEVAGLPPGAWPKDRRDGLLGDLDALDRFLGDNLDGAPMLQRLMHAVDGALSEASEAQTPAEAAPPETPPPEPAERKSTAPPPPPQPSPQPAAASPNAGDEDPETLLESGLGLVARASDLLAARDPMDPRVLRLNRIAAWMSVETLPPDDKGTTRLPPPDEQVASALERLHANGGWQDLLASAESHVPQFLFWLDLSRYSAEALDHLQRPEAREAVEAETRLYAMRLPGVERLRFTDGRPFADEETRDWLSSLKQGPGADEAPAPAGGSLEAKVAEAVNRSRDLVKENKIGEALESLLEGRNTAGAARERFLWQLGLCRLLLQARQETLIGAHVKAALAALDEFKVEQWEPALAVEALVLALKGLRGEGEEQETAREGLIRRIALLDPVKALDLV